MFTSPHQLKCFGVPVIYLTEFAEARSTKLCIQVGYINTTVIKT